MQKARAKILNSEDIKYEVQRWLNELAKAAIDNMHEGEEYAIQLSESIKPLYAFIDHLKSVEEDFGDINY